MVLTNNHSLQGGPADDLTVGGGLGTAAGVGSLGHVVGEEEHPGHVPGGGGHLRHVADNEERPGHSGAPCRGRMPWTRRPCGGTP